MKKTQDRPLPPELLAKYQEWLKNTPGGTAERYLREGSVATSPLDAEEMATFRNWLREGERAGDIEFEVSEDEESLSVREPEAVSTYDVLTYYLLKREIVRTRGQAWALQAGAALALIYLYRLVA